MHLNNVNKPDNFHFSVILKQNSFKLDTVHFKVEHSDSYWVHIAKVCYYPRQNISGGRGSRDIVSALSVCPNLSVSLSVRPSRFSVRTHILVMDFQILLSFYRNMNLQMRTAHTRFCCTAPTGNRVMALCYLQIYIVDR